MTEPTREDLIVLRRLRDGNGVIEHPTDSELHALDRLARAGLVNFERSDENPSLDPASPTSGWTSVRASIPLKGHAALLANDPELE